MPFKNVLVTGANGYIGNAVCKAFVRAGWRVYGAVRRPESAPPLERDEVIPVVANLPDLSILDGLFEHTKTFDAIIGCTDAVDYEVHFKEALDMFRRISETSNQNGVRPLVLWSSGCKDYGMTDVDGAENLTPHTESSPLNPPSILLPRTMCSLKILEQVDLFDAAVLRPTNVFGYSSSYYSVMFEHAATEASKGSQFLEVVDVRPKTILHAMHVDDCAEAYLALVEHPNRASVTGQCFNISAHRYETADTVVQALADEYKLAGGAKFTFTAEDAQAVPMGFTFQAVFGYSQWVDSGKIRALTGWTDRRLLFTQNLDVYRRAYEAAAKSGHEDIARVKARSKAWNGTI